MWVKISIETTAPVDETPGVYEDQIINMAKIKRIIPHSGGDMVKLIECDDTELIGDINFELLSNQLLTFSAGYDAVGEPLA